MVVGLQRVAEHQVPELQETLVTLLEPQSLMALAVVVVRGVEQLVLVVQLEEAPVVLQVLQVLLGLQILDLVAVAVEMVAQVVALEDLA